MIIMQACFAWDLSVGKFSSVWQSSWRSMIMSYKKDERWIILYYTQIQQEREGVPPDFK